MNKYSLLEKQNYIHYWAVSIICYSQLFYTAKLFYSPVYFILFLLMPLMIFSIIKTMISKNDIQIWLGVVVLLYITLNQLFLSTYFGAFTNFVIGMTSLLYLISVKNLFNEKQWIIWAVRSIKIGGVILLLDSIWRLTHPQHPAVEVLTLDQMDMLGFYFYKFGSIMFADSNTSAIASIVLFFLGFFLKIENRCKIDKWLFLHFLLIISCVSRSAYIAFLLSILYLWNKKWFWRLLLIGLCLFLAIGIQKIVDSDGSFESKFDILKIVIEYSKSINVEIWVFGIGLDNSVILFGIYTHILWLTYMIELGLFGTILMIGYWLLLWRTSHRKLNYLYLPMFICGLSYFFYIGAPFIFIPIGFIVILSQKRENFVNRIRGDTNATC